MEVIEIPLEEILSDSDFNCRGKVTPFEVIELARNIEAVGLQQPIVVQPYNNGKYKYKIVMGHRRFQAFKNLKRETIPCSISKRMTESEAQVLNIIENLERKDLTFMQEARAVKRLLQNHLTQAEVAKMINKSQGWVAQRVLALRLPEDIQAEIDAGFVKPIDIRGLIDIPSVEGRYEAVRELKDAKLRGESRRTRITEEKSAVALEKKQNTKKVRTVQEIFKLQDEIHNRFGPCFATRILGWAGGLVTDVEIMEDIQKEASLVAA